MHLILQPYFATEILEWGRVISRKRACIVAEDQRILLLISPDDSSLVIDELCDEAVEGDPAVVCFYFDFAARNEQSPVNMLGSLLRQLVSGQHRIPEAIAREFRKEKMCIGVEGSKFREFRRCSGQSRPRGARLYVLTHLMNVCRSIEG